MSGQILEEQRSKNWSGLAKEVSEICEKLNIQDINIHDIPDVQIKKAVAINHYDTMKEDIAKSKKMEKYKNEDFHDVQPYMKGIDIHKTRMCFRTRCEGN